MADGPGESPAGDSSEGWEQWARQLAGGSLIACAFGLAEWLLTWAEPVSTTVGTRAMAALLMLGSWSLMAWGWTTATALLLWPVVGRALRRSLRERATRRITVWWTERHSPPDRMRLATLLAAVISSTIIVTGSIAVVAHLIENRHGALLIAITAVASQLVLASLCLALGLLLRVVLDTTMARIGPVGALRFVSMPTVALGMSLLATVGVLGACWKFRDVVIATDVLAGLAPAAAAMLHVALGGVFDRRMPGGRGLLGQPILALAAVVLGSSAIGARSLVLQQSDTSRYVLAAMINAGDLDSDGSTNFPFWSDCAPLDPDVHPFAFEIEGNGRDENCDGRDVAPQLERQPWRAYRKPSGPKPNLVLVTFDAARADHFSFLGYGRDTTPGLSKLATSAVTFDNAFSQDSGTGPSLWSMMVGKTPFQVSLKETQRFPPQLGDDERPLGEVLHDGGYYSEGILCGRIFSKKYWGIERGFDRFSNVCGKAKSNTAPIVTREAIAALKRARQHEPYFLWVHYYDPHSPYNSHGRPGFGDRPIDNYDEEIRYADEHLQRFRRALQKAEGSRPLFFFFSADHGENFGGHGSSHHARTLYREVTNVPMLIAGPGLKARRVSAPVALGDLYPTLIELAQLQVPRGTTMRSLVPILYGEQPPPGRMVFQENSFSRPRRHVKGVVAGRYHYLLDTSNNTSELYDHIADPAEQHNLIGKGLDAEIALRDALLRFIPTTHVPAELAD